MATTSDKPLVTVGLIVCNEGRDIEETIDSLLAQDYGNIEIICCDNSSADDSDAIRTRAARTDARVRYIRHDDNRGALANSNPVLMQAKGEYFMWAAGRDTWAPDLISKCVAALEKSPGAAIAYGASTWVDIDGNELEKKTGWYDTRGLEPMLRFFVAFWGNPNPVLGVIRSRYLREIPKVFTCVGADQILLTELALRGDFICVRDTSRCRRQLQAEEGHDEQRQRFTSGDFGTEGSGLERQLPLLRLPIEQARSVLRSELGWIRKIAILLAFSPAYAARHLAGRVR